MDAAEAGGEEEATAVQIGGAEEGGLKRPFPSWEGDSDESDDEDEDDDDDEDGHAGGGKRRRLGGAEDEVDALLRE